MLARLRSWLRSVVFRSRMESDMDTELHWHFDEYVEHLIQSGLPRAEARRRAQLELGDIEVQKDKCRDSLGLRFLDEVGADFHFALRSLKKQRLLSVSVILTLALGIGISSGVFNFLNAATLRAQVKDPNSYVQIFSFFTMDPTRTPTQSGATLEDYRAYRDRARSVRNLAAWGAFSATFESDHLNPTRVLLVSDNFFALCGLEKAQLGRLLQPKDYGSANPVIVLSEDLWRTRFAADPRVVGKIIHVNDQPVTVVGVAPYFEAGRPWAEAWLPYTLTNYLGTGTQWSHPGETRWLEVGGRLNPGYSRADVTAELTLTARQEDKFHAGRVSSLLVTNGSEIQDPDSTKIVVVFILIMSMLVMVLLVACANVTTLLLSRADARQQEMGVRLALGAGRARLIRMLLTETCLLACIAGVASIYLTYRVPFVIWNWFGSNAAISFQPDWRVFFYFAGSILLAGMLAGLAPGLESLKVDLLSSLKGHRRLNASRTVHWNLRPLLIAAQIACSLVLLVGPAIFVRARHTILCADPGFETRQVLLTTAFMPTAKTLESQALSRDAAIRRIEAIPGVQSVALGARLPFTPFLEHMEIQFAGKSAFSVATSEVSANYFATLGIPILRGRAIERADAVCGAQSVCPIVVSQKFAGEYLNGDNILGKTLKTPEGGTLEIVGVAGDVASAPFSTLTDPVIYRAWSGQGALLQFPLSVRVNSDPNTMAGTVAAALREAYPGAEIEVSTVRSFIEQLGQTLGRFDTLIVIPAVLALVLAVIGIYGVVSFSVSKRTKEMGIRVAMGATKKDIYTAIIKPGLRPVWIGLFVGLLLALGGARIMQHGLAAFLPLEYYDPVAYAAPACLLLLLTVLAMVVPARRAAQCDPASTLREE